MLFVGERQRSKWQPSAIRAPMFAPPICREADETCQEQSRFSRNNRFVGSDEAGGYPANIAASGASDQTHSERSERSNQIVRSLIAL